ncbi:helix-turn-helix transcriptional regulator [Deinococcus pimensis]|uniref:helix-turn-helix transcriptional regulator n=1 Tax=Deinococcus pimensis TaxID=309888 RepID=UPI0004868D8D|nr:helix-turn-helix transcriptional regulator [Deinococcus pimensis]
MSPDPERILNSREDVEALLDLLARDLPLLSAFVRPATPSEAARRLGEPANRVHYRVARLARRGFLRPVERRGRVTFYEVTAYRYRVPTSAALSVSFATAVTSTVSPLAALVLAEVERRAELNRETLDRHDAIDLDLLAGPGDRAAPPPPDLGPHAPFVRARTLRLTPARYRELQSRLLGLLDEFAHDDPSGGARACSFLCLGVRQPEVQSPQGGSS